MAEHEGFPFLTREMLSAGHKSVLELVVRSNQTTQFVVQVRGFTRASKINIRHEGNSTTTFDETVHGIGDFPIMIAVAPTTLTAQHGQLYVSVSLRIDGDISVPLVAGYVTGVRGLAWPNVNLEPVIPGHGHSTVVQMANPAAGANLSFTVPDNRVLHIRAIAMQFVTDANAANRYITVEITHPGAGPIVTGSRVAHIASRDRQYTFAPGLTLPDLNVQDKFLGPLPVDTWVQEGNTIATLIEGIQVGDQLSNLALWVDSYFRGA